MIILALGPLALFPLDLSSLGFSDCIPLHHVFGLLLNITDLGSCFLAFELCLLDCKTVMHIVDFVDELLD